MQTYDDLRTGRFAVIADFENPVQMQLFQLAGASDEARCVLADSGGRTETGSASVHFTAGSSADTLVVSNAGAADWFLKRDWHHFDLLLMSVYSPREGVTAEVTLGAGPDNDRRGVYSATRLREGWNLLRLDLSEVAERLPLDDVRDIRLSAGSDAFPVTLVLDDFVLTSNQSDLFGDSGNTGGELYVQVAGRRWRIGAGGRFEISFANGQIIAWYDLRRDPNRVRNLVRHGVLGPFPVSDAPAPASGGAPDPQAISVRQRLIEMTSVRVVVVGEWRRVDASGVPLPGQPLRRWAYSIYRSGQIFVDVEETDSAATGNDQVARLAVTMSAEPADGVQTRADTLSPANFAMATARSDAAGYLLLFAPASPARARVDLSPLAEGRRTVSLVASRPASAQTGVRWSCKLLLGDADAVSDAQASLRALAYAEPTGIHVEMGSIVPFGDAAQSGSGFDRAAGCYRFRPDKGYLRCMLDGRRRPLFSPAFVIDGSRDHDAWVYVNHMLYEAVARDARGDLIFQLPGVIDNQRIIEVLVRRKHEPSGA